MQNRQEQPTIHIVDVDVKWSDVSKAISGQAIRICKSNVYVIKSFL